MDQQVIRVKALSHPLRMEIMKIYAKADKSLPIKDVADLLNQPPAKLHYHFKQLNKAGFLEVADTREINGITEKFYRHTGLDLDISLNMKENPDAVAALLPSLQRRTLAAIRRIQYLDPEKTCAGMGVYSEIALSKEKATAAKSAITDFLNHKPAHLPEPDNEDEAENYDLIIFLVPKENPNL